MPERFPRRSPRRPPRALPVLFALTALALVPGPSIAGPDVVYVGSGGNEPLLAIGPDGTIIITALQHMYASTDGGQSFFTVRRPPFAQEANFNTDSSIWFDPGGRLYFSFDWPFAGATAVCFTDLPISAQPAWTCDADAAPAVTDRMWVAAPTTTSAYMVTNLGLYETTFFTSLDRGVTWVPGKVASGLLSPQTGPLLPDPQGPWVFQVTKTGTLGFYVFKPSQPTKVRSEAVSTGLPTPLALPSGAFGWDGTLWTSTETTNTSGGRQIIVTRSTNKGRNWTHLPPIPGTTTGTATFTWVSAGSPGHVGVVFYYSTSNGSPPNMSSATWDAMWAESFDADEANPSWTVTLLEAGVHTGALCIAADCMGSNRYSGDNICSMIGADDTAHMSWMRDSRGSPEILYARMP